jgi:NRPS condensation-like uncharacterized protein
VRHTDFDGIGGFAELLRRRGALINKLPQIRHPAERSWWPFLRSAPKLLRPRYKVQWGSIERGAIISSTSSEPPQAVAWHVFDEAATTQIRRVCRKGTFTVNSFLLKHLTKAIRPSLRYESSDVPWMVPINLRGKVERERDTDNFTSYVGVRLCSFDTVHDVHRKIYAALGRGEHWANWYSYEAARPLSGPMRKYLLNKELAMSQWNLGSFSNLGDWDSDKTMTQSECEGAWLFAPPVLRSQKVGAGCVTFQNRLTLTIQVHPELSSKPEVPRGWIQNWVKEIQMDVNSILTEPHSANWMTS